MAAGFPKTGSDFPVSAYDFNWRRMSAQLKAVDPSSRWGSDFGQLECSSLTVVPALPSGSSSHDTVVPSQQCGSMGRAAARELLRRRLGFDHHSDILHAPPKPRGNALVGGCH